MFKDIYGDGMKPVDPKERKRKKIAKGNSFNPSDPTMSAASSHEDWEASQKLQRENEELHRIQELLRMRQKGE